MSIIDQANHNVVSYVSGVTKPFTGQKLVTVTYKTDANGFKKESKAVSVPVIPDAVIETNLAVLMPHVRAMLEGVQKGIIRELLDAGDNVLSIANDAISIGNCIEWMETNDESGRLTKESVGKWFDESIEATLALQLASKLGVSEVPTDAESAKIMTIIAAFKKDISALAGGKTSYNPKIATQLLKAVNLAPEGDVIASKFNARLVKMIEGTDAVYADAL